MKNALATSLIALSLVFGAETGASAEELLPGYDKMRIEAPHRGQSIDASIWYPAGRKTYKGLVGDNPVFRGTEALIGAAPADGRYPLIVLSHGSGGNMDTIGWLSAGLVKAGFMVLAVNHPGSTSGDSSPRRSIRLWERAPDLTAALDAFLAGDPLARLVDTDRIIAAGFSLGGVTALQLGGLRTDKQAYADYCDRHGDAAQDCLFFAKGGVDIAALPLDKFNAELTDPRISAVVAIEPGMSYAFDQDSMAANRLPVLLINFGERASRWPTADMSPLGSDFAARLPKADYIEIAPGAHYTFLAECKPGARQLLEQEGEDPICDDPAGTDRADVHNRVIAAIAGFLR